MPDEEGDKIEVTCGLVSGQRAPISGQRPATLSGCRDLYVWIYSLLLRHQQKLYYGKIESGRIVYPVQAGPDSAIIMRSHKNIQRCKDQQNSPNNIQSRRQQRQTDH